MKSEDVLKTASDWYYAHCTVVAANHVLDLLGDEYDSVLSNTDMPDYEKIRKLYTIIQTGRESLDKSRKELEASKTKHWIAIQDWIENGLP